MLLQSITKHVKEQNWFAVALDFFIVVVGILIAFQISNWNAARQEVASQQLVHQRLQQDFDLIEQESDQAVAYIEELMTSLITLQNAIARGSVEDGEEEQIKHALERWFSYPTFNQRSGTYIELLSSGRLDLIDSEKLRIELSEYDRGVQQSKFNETRIHEFLIQNVTISDIGRHRTFAQPYRNDRKEIVRGQITSFDFAAMASDVNLRFQLDAIIENRTWLIGNIYGQRRNAQSVVSLLQETK